MQGQEQVEICKNVLNAIHALYTVDTIDNKQVEVPEVVTKDEKYLNALDILVFNGYLTTSDNLRFEITELGIGAVLFGFENAERIFTEKLL